MASSPTEGVNVREVGRESTTRMFEHLNTPTFRASHVLLSLIAFRLVNALLLKTFFQPDEFYQALEPAWQLAFGADSGAWMTWEWTHHLRSASHPALFAVMYRLSNGLATILNLPPSSRADMLLAAPKTLQAFIATLGEYYTWKLSAQIYGRGSRAANMTLLLTVLSPWQWFCSTRTFSNCLETTLTTVALYHWPCHWVLSKTEQDFSVNQDGLRIRQTDDSTQSKTDELTRLRRAILCAALATILRPTNILVWASLTIATFSRGLTFMPHRVEALSFVREGIICGGLILVLSALVDRVFYDAWTLPTLNFFYFNVVQSLAVFYGNNNWHYYLSQGYPLLLTTALPFAIIGLYQVFRNSELILQLSPSARFTLYRLAMVSIVLPAFLSIISHKEVRFIYPILPALHIIAALPLSRFSPFAMFGVISPTERTAGIKGLIIVFLTCANVLLAFYISVQHSSGVISITNYFRHEFETHYQQPQDRNLTFALFMPCHSTPWRSHLQYPPSQKTPGISGWALTCEPPVDLNAEQKVSYLDEADIFYESPSIWLKKNMSRRPSSHAKHEAGIFPQQPKKWLWQRTRTDEDQSTGIWVQQGDGVKSPTTRNLRAWPDYIAFFSQLEPTMQTVLRGSGYSECWRGFNSHWHDDWRRSGDVIVWCLFPERKLDQTTSYSWWSAKHQPSSQISSVGISESSHALTEDEVEDALHNPGKRREL